MIVRRSRVLSVFGAPHSRSVVRSQVLETKDFTTWSEKECNEIITKSPWAYSNSFGEVPPIGQQTAGIEERSGVWGPQLWRGQRARRCLNSG